MTLIGLLIFIVVFFALAAGAYALSTKFFQPPAQGIVLAVVGVVLLIILLATFLPEVATYRVWR